MRKMGKHKMIAKSCPKCELQVAVASKSCKCGHTFFAARRGADCLPAVEDIKRRTGRVRRSQPQFYDAQHYQKQIKRRSPKKRSLSRSMDEDNKPKDKAESARARRRRALRRAQRPPPGNNSGERTRDPTPQLRPPQLARCRLILQEINRKISAVTWQPPNDM
ncbi:hypothetical protein PYW07_012737 [Mythimna separata]|uniref:UPF0547 domain-containing protein n=2 Tax=Mythimna TaxID=103830 RepID=A0AAD7Y934_MYTSE|nr:hypothetical protein PYW08_012150 [Mythimna loreyi]KAJ8706659.1 hypothetical protein PYW07_012737 [Mythimna separata]